jgi:hypothetical protein
VTVIAKIRVVPGSVVSVITKGSALPIRYASCPKCNYGDGARVAAENTRMTIEKLRALVWEQQADCSADREAWPLRGRERPSGAAGLHAGDPLTYRPEQELLADLGRYGFRDTRVSSS